MGDNKNKQDIDLSDPYIALIYLGILSCIGGMVGGGICLILLSIAKVLIAALFKVLGFSIATRETILAFDVYAMTEPSIMVFAIMTAVYCVHQFFNKSKHAGAFLLYISIATVIVLFLNGWEMISKFATG